MQKIPIATTITIGRRFNGTESSPQDDFHIAISGHVENVLDDGTVLRTALTDIHCNLSQVISDPAVAQAFPLIYDAIVRIMNGQLVPVVPVIEEPVVEEPIVEESVIETTVVEEPVVETPVE